MSVATDPALLARYTSGKISYADYREEMARRQQTSESAHAVAALEAAKGVSPTLTASEVALQRENLIASQERAARATAQRRQKEAETAALRQAQAQADADRRARDAAAARARTGAARAAAAVADKAAQRRLAAQRAAIATQQTTRLRTEQARQRAEQQRVSELAEAARQKMIAEQGRVIAPEQEGRVIAEASAQARAEQAYLAGEIVEPPEMYAPVYELYEQLPGGYEPPAGAAQYTPSYTPSEVPVYTPQLLPTSPIKYSPPYEPPVYTPWALPMPPEVHIPPYLPPAPYPPDLPPFVPPTAPPFYEWPETVQPSVQIGIPPYIVGGPGGKQTGLSAVAGPLLIGAVVFLLTGYWLAT